MNTETTDTTEPTTPRRRNRPEQMQIHGTERQFVPEVETAANAYRNIRDERMELTKLEVVRRDELIRVMTEHKLDVYKYDDDEGVELTIKLDTKTKVKVRRADSVDSEDA